MARPKTLGPCIECGEPGYARQRCRRHYKAWQRTAIAEDKSEQCSTDDCTYRRFARGYCYSCYQLHWSRAKFNRDPDTVSVGKKLAHKDPVERFRARVDTSRGTDACHPWLGTRNSAGYGLVQWNGKQVRAQRVAYFLHTGEEIPDDQEGCHTCDNPPCCNGAHIFPGTRGENWADMRIKNRHSDPPLKFGVEHHGAKLTEADVVEIRRRRGAGEVLSVLSAEFGVSPTVISKIGRRQAWRHVPG